MEPEPRTGLLDLERELTCSICTEVLYQPLTLLDCLHTFCGSCLKTWFAFQAIRASSQHPYTCPSCRATVRETRPNATVITLLDMFLQVNPNKAKAEAEKKEISEKYRAGERVLLRITRTSRTREHEQDHVRDLSLRQRQDGGHRTQASFESRTAGSPGARDARDNSRDHGAARDRSRTGQWILSTSPTSRGNRETRSRARSPGPSETNEPVQIPPLRMTRAVEHQSSLRSLMSSASSLGTSDMEDEIMRQVIEEGLLDGIDLNSINRQQEDEISERIAQAYLRRRRERAESASTPGAETSRPSGLPPSSVERSAQVSQRLPRSQSTMRLEDESVPSIPDTRSSENSERNGRHRTSGGTRRRATSDYLSTASALSGNESRTAASRSATDLSNGPPLSGMPVTRPRRYSQTGRRTTEPNPRHPTSPSVPLFPPRRSIDIDRPLIAGARTTSNPVIILPLNLARAPANLGMSPDDMRQPSIGVLSPDRAVGGSTASSRPSSSSSVVTTNSRNRMRPALYPEPTISCDRCGKQHLEYALHYRCGICKDGQYSICLTCYRQGKGCENWYGFGSAGRAKYERLAPLGGYPPDQAAPHSLTGHRYSRPKQPVVQARPGGTTNPLTTEDPRQRLQAGSFCSIDGGHASDFHWKCDPCNDGEWGYCTPCVDQGRCCTHPLLPVANIPVPVSSPPFATGPTSSLSCDAELPALAPQRHDGSPVPPMSPTTASSTLTICSRCKFPIQPSTTRYHCSQCLEGKHDTCTPCYLNLVATALISAENGPQGWRRCLEGHRMIVVGFEDRDGGRKRIVVRDLVGGRALQVESKETAKKERAMVWTWRKGSEAGRWSRLVTRDVKDTATNDLGAHAAPFPPPDGGNGMRMRSLWGYFPADEVEDELMFPRGAEITEVEDVNGDWFWGVYAGSKGLFPGGYVRSA